MKNEFILITKFHNEIVKDPTHRYKSWEHCFVAFQKEKDINILALHLGFYLASWGMYRGSSGLLQKDYTVHLKAVEILLKPKFNQLRCVTNNDVDTTSINLILECKKELSDYYSKIEYTKEVNETKKVKATDTLISKIMLGALGCIPAYDRYFIDGLKATNISGFTLNNKSLKNLFGFVNENKQSLFEIQKEISKNGIHYPIMKIIDMYFWTVGFEVEKNKKLSP